MASAARRFHFMLPSAVLALLTAASSAAGAPRDAGSAPRVSGPYVYENLDVYPLHGSLSPAGRRLVPLARALSENKVVVRETSNVNELTVENVSDEEVFLQAGEIVKGGKQDRVLGSDLVLEKRSGPQKVKAHCVERGRWRQRGAEAPDRFSSSAANAADRQLKLANYRGSQSEVWAGVDKLQKQLASKLGTSVQARESASSLQLTLEHERVAKSAAAYVRAFQGLLQKHPDAIGYVFAIDGQLNSGESYGSRALFEELWPKLLKATAVEAVAAPSLLAAHVPPSLASVQAFLAAAETGARSERPAAGPLTSSAARDTATSLMVETRETRSQTVIHKSYVAK